MDDNRRSVTRRAVVLRVEDSYAVVLTDNGFVLRVPYRGRRPKVGEESHLTLQDDPENVSGVAEEVFELPPPPLPADEHLLQERPGRRRPVLPGLARIAVAASLAAALMLGAILWPGRPDVAAVMVLDINPSLELRVSATGTVIGAVAYNREGQELIDAWGGSPATAEGALRRLIVLAGERGYLDNPDATTIFVGVVTLSGGDEAGWDEKALAAVGSAVELQRREARIIVYRADGAAYREALPLNISLNRLMVQRHLGLADPDTAVGLVELLRRGGSNLESFVQYLRTLGPVDYHHSGPAAGSAPQPEEPVLSLEPPSGNGVGEVQPPPEAPVDTAPARRAPVEPVRAPVTDPSRAETPEAPVTCGSACGTAEETKEAVTDAAGDLAPALEEPLRDAGQTLSDQAVGTAEEGAALVGETVEGTADTAGRLAGDVKTTLGEPVEGLAGEPAGLQAPALEPSQTGLVEPQVEKLEEELDTTTTTNPLLGQ